MLFNSYQYIFIFLPLSFFLYFFLNRKKLTTASNAFLLASSLFFYGWWNILYLPLLVGSIIFNFALGAELAKPVSNKRFQFISKKTILIFGIAVNLAFLAYFKYSNFFIENLNVVFGFGFNPLHVVLPLAISFFTFTQIAYLVDSYKGQVKEYDFLNYSLFVTFFPHLIAGPIVHHKEIMPQFSLKRNKLINYQNIAAGIFLISVGVFKKVIIADNFTQVVKAGFDNAVTLTFMEAWVTSLSYTFQIYFDFSGYMDMALGAALLFNIKMPLNFNSPYKALDIQDFWKRWHMTLSRFLRDYLYIPMGGNREGAFNTYRNVMITFILGGLWHGASWTFIIWGLLHGTAVIIHRIWSKLGYKLNVFLAWFITFNFINMSWVFFRAKNFDDAKKVFKGMLGFNGIVLPHSLSSWLGHLNRYGVEFQGTLKNIQGDKWAYIFLAFAFIAASFKEPYEEVKHLKNNYVTSFIASFLFVVSVLGLNRISEFIYFNF